MKVFTYKIKYMKVMVWFVPTSSPNSIIQGASHVITYITERGTVHERCGMGDRISCIHEQGATVALPDFGHQWPGPWKANMSVPSSLLGTVLGSGSLAGVGTIAGFSLAGPKGAAAIAFLGALSGAVQGYVSSLGPQG